MAYKIINSGEHRKRRSFSKIKNTFELKDLLEIQKKPYQWFIDTGIKEVFEDLFPVENCSGTLSVSGYIQFRHNGTFGCCFMVCISNHDYHCTAARTHLCKNTN